MQSQKIFISKKGLQELDKYSYKSFGYTWLDSKMNVLWQCMASVFPKRMAPNLITFIGFMFIIMSYVIMLFYDYTFRKNIPGYCFLFAGLFVFLYMNLDAIDGKQARNIKASSPLGQLFDHGCDSFSLTFVALAICQATKLRSPEVFLLFMACQLGFFTANWMQYHTGLLRTKIGQIGVTQIQFLCIFIHLITAYYGQDIWGIQIGSIVPNMYQMKYPHLYWLWTKEIKTIIVYVFTLSLALNLLYVYFSTIVMERKRFRVAAEFVPLYLLIVMQFIWFYYLPIYEKYGGIILLNFGLLLSLMVCKMIVCSVTKMKFQYLHKQSINFMITTSLMLIVNNWGEQKWNLSQRQINRIQLWLFWLCFTINLISILRFLVRVVKQLTDYLGIYCFSIDKKPRITDLKNQK